MTDVFNYTVANGVGAANEATSTITINITGTDDNVAPVLYLGGGAFVLDQFTTQAYGAWTKTGDDNSATSGEFTIAHDPTSHCGAIPDQAQRYDDCRGRRSRFAVADLRPQRSDVGHVDLRLSPGNP